MPDPNSSNVRMSCLTPTPMTPTPICSQLHGQKICIRGNHDRNASWMTRVGFNVVLESAFLKIGSHLVELIHIPSEQAPTHFQLHGHVHDKRPRKIISNQLNLCVEVWDYKPAAEKTILSLLDKASKNEISFKVPNSDFLN